MTTYLTIRGSGEKKAEPVSRQSLQKKYRFRVTALSRSLGTVFDVGRL